MHHLPYLLRRWALCVLSALLLLSAWQATAQAAVTGPIVVDTFHGSKAQGLRTLVAELLTNAGYEIVAEENSPDLSSAEADSDFAQVALGGKLRAFVQGQTKLSKRDWVMTLSVRDGKSGASLGETEIVSRSYPGLQKALRGLLIQKLAPLLERTTSPAPAPVAAAEPEPEKAASAPEKPESQPEPVVEPPPPPEPKAATSPYSAFEFALGPAFVQRVWDVNDILPGTLAGRLSPTHSVSLASVHLGLSFYPVALASEMVLRHVGLDVAFDRSLFGSTAIDDGGVKEDRVTSLQRLMFGLRIRIPIGSMVEPQLWGGVGNELLRMDGEKSIAAMPDVDADFVRAGLDLKIKPSTDLAISVGFGYRRVLRLGDDAGELGAAEWFPEAKAKGLEGMLQGDYRLSELLWIRASAAASRDVYTLNPMLDTVRANSNADAEAPPVAGGATDWHWTGKLALALALPGYAAN